MLSQLFHDTWHVGHLASKDIFVVLKKVGEREFLFFRNLGTHGCRLGGSLVPRSFCLTSTSLGGARMLVF